MKSNKIIVINLHGAPRNLRGAPIFFRLGRCFEKKDSIEALSWGVPLLENDRC